MSVIYTFMYILCLSTTVSDAFVRRAMSSHRQCNVVLRNYCTSHKLQNPGLYMVSGSSTGPYMSRNIGTNMKTHMKFRKNYGMKGTVGVFTYDLVNTKTNRVDKKLAFMFSVPFNFLFHSNWFAAGFFPKYKACDRKLYREMYYKREGLFVRSEASHLVIYTHFISHKDGRFKVQATMTNTLTPDMYVDVYDG